MSTKRSVLFVVAGVAAGVLLTVIISTLLQRCDTPPDKTPPAKPAPVSETADTESPRAGARSFETPEWNILTPARPMTGNCTICGQIFDDTRAPLSGATVRLRLLDEPWKSANLAQVATTDKKGKYCFTDLTEQASYQLFAWSEGFATASYEEAVCGAATDLSLEKGAVLTLRFVDADGYSIPYVEVHIAGSALWPMRRALSDERGRISIKGLSEGVYSFEAHKGNLAFSVLEPVALGPGEEIELEAQMTEIPPVRIAVKAGQDDGAVPNAVITSVPVNESLLARTTLSDAHGNASIPGSSVAGVSLRVFAPGYTPQKVEHLLPGATAEIRLLKGAEIRGVVQTPGGKPIEGAQISIRAVAENSTMEVPGYADRLFMLEKAAAERDGLPQAIDVDGDASCITGPSHMPLPATGNPPKQLTPLTTWIESNSAGEFVLDGIPEGDFSLSAAHSEYVVFRRPTLSVIDNQSLTGIPILMKPGASLTLRVVTLEGQPIGEAAVTVFDMDGEIVKEGETASNGYVELTGLPEQFRVQAVAPQYIPGTKKIFGPPGDTVDTFIRLEDANMVLRGRVVNPHGIGIPGLTVEAELSKPGMAQVLTGATEGDGTFALDGAGDGNYLVRVRVDGEVRATVSDATAQSEIQLQLIIEDEEESAGVTSLSPRPQISQLAPSRTNIPAPDANRFGSGDSLGVTSGGGSPAPSGASRGRLSPYNDVPSSDVPSSYTTGSSSSAYGESDDLVVTGPPAGIGTVPISLKSQAGKIIVASVQPGSLVDAAGLKSGAQLTTIDGEPIKGIAMANRALQGPIGSVVMIEVEQDGEPLSVVVQRERK